MRARGRSPSSAVNRSRVVRMRCSRMMAPSASSMQIWVSSLEEDHRVVGERSPHAAGQREFAGARGADGGGCHEIVAQGEERDHAQLRVAGPRIGAGRGPNTVTFAGVSGT